MQCGPKNAENVQIQLPPAPSVRGAAARGLLGATKHREALKPRLARRALFTAAWFIHRLASVLQHAGGCEGTRLSLSNAHPQTSPWSSVPITGPILGLLQHGIAIKEHSDLLLQNSLSHSAGRP